MDNITKYNQILKQIETMDEEVHNTKSSLKGLIKRIVNTEALKQPVKDELIWYFEKLSGRPKSKLKSLQEAFFFQKITNTPIKQVKKKQVDEWWGKQKHSFDVKVSAHATLQKRLVQTRKYARVVCGMRRGRYPLQFDHLELPLQDEREQKRRAEYYTKLPSIKKLLAFIKVGKKNMAHLSETNSNENYFTIRDKFLKSFHVDSGARAESIYYINIRDVQDIGESDFLLVTLERSKSEQAQAFSFISKPYLEQLLALHPTPDEPNSPLLLNRNYERLSYDKARDIIKNDAKKVGLEFPKSKKGHYFRNILVSRMSKAGWTDEEMNVYLGWKGDHMRNIYDLSKEGWRKCIQPYRRMLKKEGIQGRACSNCKTVGFFDYCEDCGKKLKAITFIGNKEAIAEKMVIKELQEFPEFKNLLERLIEKHENKKV